MEKIIKVALETKFGNADKLLEVVAMTPNPEHAVEILLDIYEEPVFKAIHKYTYRHKGPEFKDLEAAHSSYNPWNNELTIVVRRPTSIEIAVLNESYDLVNKENYQDFVLTREQRNDKDWKWKTIIMDEFENVKETLTDFNDWYVTEFD